MSATTRLLILNERDPRHPKAGGAEVHLAELAPRLALRGYELTQLACSFSGASREDNIDALCVKRLGPLAAYYPRAAWTCARETRSGRFDVVLEILCKLPFFATLYSAAPVVALCHHLLGRTAFLQAPWPVAATVYTAENLIPFFYRRPPFVVGSASTRDDLIQRGIASERIHLIPYGRREVAPANGADSAAQGEPPARVCYLGRLEPYKKVDVMLRAVARLTERFPEIEILVIGRGIERERLEKKAAELGLSQRTHFSGFVPENERDALLASSRVCVCPSQKEGWGLTVIEANALGVPVVASDAPGLRDSVRDGETGFLAPEGDVAAFAERIGQLLADDALHARMSAAAREWSDRFDWERATDELDAVLQNARRAS